MGDVAINGNGVLSRKLKPSTVSFAAITRHLSGGVLLKTRFSDRQELTIRFCETLNSFGAVLSNREEFEAAVITVVA